LRHSKKLTRTQRNLLIKAGYKKDLHNLYYIMDKGNELLFIDGDCNKVLYNKSSKTVTEVVQGE
jgi:hypothetical protein